jgi:hypothetical protein
LQNNSQVADDSEIPELPPRNATWIYSSANLQLVFTRYTLRFLPRQGIPSFVNEDSWGGLRTSTLSGGKIMRARIFTALYAGLCITLLFGSQSLNAQQGQGGRVISIREDRPDLNFVGQFISFATGSDQFGYLSKIEGISNVFNSTTVKDEGTAMFTFVNHALNVQVVNNGPLRAVSRKGTTTIYYHPEGGANFADPASFAVGIPIQASDYDQLVMIDPSVSFPFLTTHLNTITSTESFVLNGEMLRLGHEHGAWRTHYLGLQNVGTSPVTGYFLGYAVGVSNDQD